MDLSQSVEDQNRKQMLNVSIQNASHWQKQIYDQRAKTFSCQKKKSSMHKCVGGKPTNPKTFRLRKQAMKGGND